MIEKKPTPLLQRIFELRKARGISLDDLGRVMGGITRSTTSSIENGIIPLRAEYIPAIAKLLGVAPWELFIDYDAGETGPLDKDEKTLVLNFRLVETDSDRRTIQNVVKQFAKKR